MQGRLREVMAQHKIFTATDVMPLPRDRGIELSAWQVHRLVSTAWPGNPHSPEDRRSGHGPLVAALEPVFSAEPAANRGSTVSVHAWASA